MTISKQIKEDWGTLRHFAKKNDIVYGSLKNALVGKRFYKEVTRKLIELEYISSEEDLKKVA